MTSVERLRAVTYSGIEKRYFVGDDSTESLQVGERVEYELAAITKAGLADYFLLLWDMYDFMESVGIPYGPGRGSAAASIVCYALGITGVCPLKYDLLFERFISPERVSMCDIDCDISSLRRDEVIQYLKERWGEDKVVQIVTFGTLGARAAIRDMSRVISKPLALAEKLAKMIPKNGSITTDREQRDYIRAALDTVKEFKEAYQSDHDAREIIDAAIQVEGIIRNQSLHAAGICIADKPVSDYAPLLSAKPVGKGERPMAVAYDMNELEGIGLIKFDLLGLTCLDTIARVVEQLKREGKLSLDFSINSIPLDDHKTYNMLGEGLTQGVFQFECVAGDTILNGDPTKTIAQAFIYQPKRMQSIDISEGKRHSNSVLRVVETGEKQLYRLNTEHGYTLRTTADHKILSEFGWLMLSELKQGDRIVVNAKDASRIGCCSNCGKQKRSRIGRCNSCANVARDSGTVMNNMRDQEQWLKSIARGREHPWWGGHPRTVNLVFDDLSHPVSSKWEADFARYINAIGEPYQYESRTFIFSDGSGYTPDFYLPNSGTWIEVKGRAGLCGRGKTKVERFREEFPKEKLRVVTAHEIAEFELSFPDLAKWNCPTLPDHFSFEEVKSIAKDQIEMTYDVMMKAPLNNYIANGIVVHNSGGMAGWLRKMKPDRIDDLIAMVALYRPGPMAFIPNYVDRKLGSEIIKYPHKSLVSVLESTYGVVVFQEQIMKIGQIVAGWSLTRADQLRKVIGKKLVDKIQGEKDQFILDAGNNGFDPAFAGELFTDCIEPAAKYSFNKGHATVYGILAYQTAYLKANYPCEYFGSLLESADGDKIKISTYISDARATGVSVVPPDVNSSSYAFLALSTGIPRVTFGLASIKNVGERACKLIIEEREREGPFLDLFDLVSRTQNRLVTTQTLQSLILAGALDSLPGTRQEKFSSVAVACERFDKLKEDNERILIGKPAVKRKKPIPERELVVPTEEAMEINLLAKERELLGCYLSAHPFGHFATELSSLGKTVTEVKSLQSSGMGTFTLVGIVSSMKEIVTKKKSRMLSLILEDSELSCEVIVFPKQTSEYRDIICLDQPLVVFGRFEETDEDDANPKILLEKCYTMRTAPIKRINLQINRYMLKEDSYEAVIGKAKAPCSFCLPDGLELYVK